MSSPVWQVLESSARLPLAMAALGLQEGARALSGRSGAVREAEAAFYLVSQAAQRDFGDLLLGGFQIGDAIQRGVVDAIFGPWSSEPGPAGFFFPALPCPAPRNWRLAVQELRNKIEVYNLVRQAARRLSEPDPSFLPAGSTLPVMTLIEHAYSLPDYERIWAVEGLGHDYAAFFMRESAAPPRDILIAGPAANLPAASLTMMHAGIGLAFAQYLWDGISPYDPEARIRGAIERFDRLCADNSRQGYAGAARESLGLVTRTTEPVMLKAADRAIRVVAPDLAGYFWHGAGRALYFAPTHFVPGLTSPWAGILDTAPHARGTCNLIAGLAWATALVNMRQPEIVADLVLSLDRRILDTGAFSDGVASALMAAYDVDASNPWIEGFFAYVPPDPGAAAAWEAVVRQPGRCAFERTYPDLKNNNRLEELFHCCAGDGN